VAVPGARRSERGQPASAGSAVLPPGLTLTYDFVINEIRRCAWCGRGLPERSGAGRPRRFCRDACRQRSFHAKARAAEVGLTEAELVIARNELEELRDALYVLEAAVEDVDRDLAAAADDPAELKRALDWLLDAARPLLRLRP
jgi:hypothetical protein